jgi:hypothetical protein
MLSLDAPLIAVLWQAFLAYRFSIPLRPAAEIALGLTVWAIYLLDRLLDARKPPPYDEPARHRFYRRNRRIMTALLAFILATDSVVAFRWLRPTLLREGLIAAGGVALYLTIFHLSKRSAKVPKEIATALLFTAGTFLAGWATLPCLRLAWAALAFFFLCLANMVAIEAWEWRELSNAAAHDRPHALTRWLANAYLLWVPAAVIFCAAMGHNAWYESIALSAGACALLYGLGRRVPLDARRALVDGVLLTPLLFLILR